MGWINFAYNCACIYNVCQIKLLKKYEEVGKMLGIMANNPEKFLLK